MRPTARFDVISRVRRPYRSETTPRVSVPPDDRAERRRRLTWNVVATTVVCVDKSIIFYDYGCELFGERGLALAEGDEFLKQKIL